MSGVNSEVFVVVEEFSGLIEDITVYEDEAKAWEETKAIMARAGYTWDESEKCRRDVEGFEAKGESGTWASMYKARFIRRG